MCQRYKITASCALLAVCLSSLKGLSRVILGNFSTDQMVIELTEISQQRIKTIEELNQKHRKAKKVHGWTKLERIQMGYIFYLFTQIQFE